MLLAQLFIANPGLKTAETNRIAALPEGAEAPLIAQIKSWFTCLANPVAAPLPIPNAVLPSRSQPWEFNNA